MSARMLKPMPSRIDNTPRLRLPFAAAAALLLLAACVMFVRNDAAGNGNTDDGANPHSGNPHTASPLSEAAAPALTRKSRPIRSEADAAARKAREDEETAAAAKEARRKKLASYLAPGYQLKPEFLTDYGLSLEQFAAAQRVLDQERADLAQWAASHVTYDGEASANDPDHAHIFRIPAQEPGAVGERLARLMSSLDAATNGNATAPRDIAEAVRENPFFGFYGAADGEVRFVPNGPSAVRNGNPYDISFVMRDRISGTIARVRGDFVILNPYYGDIFELPK